MKITFCGHSDFCSNEEYKKTILAFLREKIMENHVEFLLGGYGNFDRFAYDCCKIYKETNSDAILTLVTPYLSAEYQQKNLETIKYRYDTIVYPTIENRPLRYAIVYRNRYMVEQADIIVAYVSHDWGGAYSTYKYAKKKGKEIFNLADFK